MSKQTLVLQARQLGVPGKISRMNVAELSKAIRAAEIAAEAAAQVTPVDEAPADNPVDRTRLAKAEKQALDAWVKDGSNPPRPATPNLDALRGDYETKKAGGPVAAKAPKIKQGPGSPVQFTVNGRDMPASQNFVSALGWYATQGIDGRDALRSGEFKALLAGLGVADPMTFPWEVTLPNGVRVGARDASAPVAAVA